jgi:hypothetical protein
MDLKNKYLFSWAQSLREDLCMALFFLDITGRARWISNPGLPGHSCHKDNALR